MMSPDELRDLADALEPMAAAPRFDGLSVAEFCAWLRQCAEQRPVGEIVEAHGLTGVSIPEMPAVGTMLYAAPVLPQREPLSDDKIEGFWETASSATDNYFDMHEFARMIERAHGIGGSDER